LKHTTTRKSSNNKERQEERKMKQVIIKQSENSEQNDCNVISPYLSIITLTRNGQNPLIKRHIERLNGFLKRTN
jgi:hypothetical protein